MFCESCGSFIPDGQSFCSNCGSPAPRQAAPQQAAQPVQPVAAQPVQPVAQPVQPVAQPVQPIVAQPVQPIYQQPVQPVYQQPAYAQPVYQQQPAAAVAAKKRNGAATAGLVMGIVNICLAWIPFFNIFTTSLLGLLGLIFSIVGIAKKNAGGKGKAIAGLILAILATGFTVLYYAYIANTIKNDPELNAEWSELMEEFDEVSYYSTSYSADEDGNYLSYGDGDIIGILNSDGTVVEC